MKNNPIEKIRDLLAEPEARRKAAICAGLAGTATGATRVTGVSPRTFSIQTVATTAANRATKSPKAQARRFFVRVFAMVQSASPPQGMGKGAGKLVAGFPALATTWDVSHVDTAPTSAGVSGAAIWAIQSGACAVR